VSKEITIKGYAIKYFPKHSEIARYSQRYTNRKDAIADMEKFTDYYKGRKKPKVVRYIFTEVEYTEEEKRELKKQNEQINAMFRGMVIAGEKLKGKK
jgi:ATP-dependent RNA circularization protein (DNA/RNA ligase family)